MQLLRASQSRSHGEEDVKDVTLEEHVGVDGTRECVYLLIDLA